MIHSFKLWLAFTLYRLAKYIAGERLIDKDLLTYMYWDCSDFHPADANKHLTKYREYQKRVKESYYTYRTNCHNGDHEWDDHAKDGWVYCWICGSEAEIETLYRTGKYADVLSDRKHRKYSSNEIDLAYSAGVFNMVGVDGLVKELNRLKELGKRPSDIFDKEDIDINIKTDTNKKP